MFKSITVCTGHQLGLQHGYGIDRDGLAWTFSTIAKDYKHILNLSWNTWRAKRR
jgi:hypothetical protein